MARDTPRGERAEFDAYMAWLGTVIDRPGSSADAAKLYADFSDTMRILREEAAKRTSTLSNDMKSRHDTVKNSISNVR